MSLTSVSSKGIRAGGCVILPPFKPVQVKATSNDPTQKITAEKMGFRISGVASNNGIVQSRVTVNVDGKQIVVPLSGRETPAQTAKLIAKALPPGYELTARPTHRNLKSDVIVSIRRKPVLPSRLPLVKVASNDPTQRATSLTRNKFEISGAASNNGIVPSRITLTVDGKTVQVPVGRTAEETARKVAAALPKGYKAEVSMKPIPPNVRVDPRAWPWQVTVTRA